MKELKIVVPMVELSDLTLLLNKAGTLTAELLYEAGVRTRNGINSVGQAVGSNLCDAGSKLYVACEGLLEDELEPYPSGTDVEEMRQNQFAVHEAHTDTIIFQGSSTDCFNYCVEGGLEIGIDAHITEWALHSEGQAPQPSVVAGV